MKRRIIDMVNGKEKLIVAIDTDNFEKAKEMIDKLEDSKLV